MTKDFAFYFDRWIIFPLEYLSWKIFWGLKIILWTFSRYSSCFMWNVEMGRSSGERAERFFCEAIVCCKMTAFWKDSGRLSHSKMKTTGLICWTISSFYRCYRCCFSRCYCSCPQERSVLVSGYCLYWPFTCYFCTHCSDVKNLKASVVRWTRCTKFISHVKTPFIQFFSFQRVTYAVQDSLNLSEQLFSFPVFQLSHIESSRILLISWCRVFAFSLTSFKEAL